MALRQLQPRAALSPTQKITLRLPLPLFEQLDNLARARQNSLDNVAGAQRPKLMEWLTQMPEGRQLMEDIKYGKLGSPTSKQLDNLIKSRYYAYYGIEQRSGRPRTRFAPPLHILRDEVIISLLTEALATYPKTVK